MYNGKMVKLAEIPKLERPREKLVAEGVASLSASELLAIVLGSGIKGKNVQELSQQIIQRFGKNFLDVTIDDLQAINGIGKVRAQVLIAAIELVKRYYDNALDLKNIDAVAEQELLALLDIQKPAYTVQVKKINKGYRLPYVAAARRFQMQNRRYLGNKYKLLGFIEDILADKCAGLESLCDIFAGTGVVGARFNHRHVKIISNDFLASNHVCNGL